MSERAEPVTTQFGRIPYDMAAAGAYAGLSAAAANVLLILAAHTHKDWRCYPAVITIAKETGRNVRTVQRGLRELQRRGLIRQTEAGGGRGRATVYQLATNPGEIATLSREQTPANRTAKPRRAAPETPADSARNPGPQATPTAGTNLGTKQTEQTADLRFASKDAAGLSDSQLAQIQANLQRKRGMSRHAGISSEVGNVRKATVPAADRQRSIQLLLKAGLSPADAADLANLAPTPAIEAALPSAMRPEVRNPGGYLRRALERAGYA